MSTPSELYDFSADVEEYTDNMERQWLKLFSALKSLTNECAQSSALVKELPTLPEAMKLLEECKLDSMRLSNRRKKATP